MHSKKISNIASCLLLCVGLTSCGGGSSSSQGASSGGSGSGASADNNDGFDMEGFEEGPTVNHGSQSARELLGVNPPPKAWNRMTYAEKEEHMIAYVLPIAAESFANQDRERYSEFQCNTCHGDDAVELHYRLPSRYLPPLPAPGTPEWTAMEATPAYRFMADDVTPTVRTQLGLPEYNARTGRGFGCFSCHTQRGAPATPAAAPSRGRGRRR